MDVLKTDNLTKNFEGKKAVDSLSLSVPENSVFGFIGPNGAGKTTTMRMILGLLKPSGGSITVCGEQVVYGQTGTNRFIGYLPDVPEFYSYMNAHEYLKLCGEVTGMQAPRIRTRSDELLHMVGLSDVRKRIGGYSRGMKQRLGIAQAMLNEPKLLLCDEPTSALDPIGRKEILDILRAARGKTTVLFSTHILSDVESVCDRVAVLREGKLALWGTIAGIKARHRHDSLAVEFVSSADMAAFAALPGIEPYLANAERTEKGILIRSSDIGKAESSVLIALAGSELLPQRLEILEPTLENLFLEAVQ